jgi:hypothetical protein
MVSEVAVECPDYLAVKSAAKRGRQPPAEWLALSPGNDPFYITNGRTEAAEWFADLWLEHGFGRGTHLRRIHYVLVSNPVRMPNGAPYENTERCWGVLGDAGRDARYLGLVDAEDFVDRRNPAPVVHLLNPAEGSVSATAAKKIAKRSCDLPAAPRLMVSAPTVPGRYHVEIWAEKSTQNDILLPLARQYRANLVTGVGEMSLTACDAFVERARASARPVRVLYVSDFDPAGLSMPVAVARKIEFGLRNAGVWLDVQVRPVVLTHEQCERYALPRTPLKEGERRADGFEYIYGTGATELDALEALHPGTLAEIIRAELNRYHDAGLSARLSRKRQQADRVLTYISDRVLSKRAAERAELQARYAELVSAFNAGAKDLRAEFARHQRELADELLAVAPQRIRWPEPAEGNDDPNPMFDGLRPYGAQLARYKRHQQKHRQRPKQGIPDSIWEALGIGKGAGVVEPISKPTAPSTFVRRF